MSFKKVSAFYILLLSLIALNCTRDERAEPSEIRQLQVYNDVLDDLVRNRFYYRYLDSDRLRELQKRYDYDIPGFFDSISYYKEFNKLKEEIESDTAKQKSILIGKEFNSEFKMLSKYDLSHSSDNPYQIMIQNSLLAVSPDIQRIYDSLRLPQKHFLAKDFYSSAFKISSSKNEIGAISFSRLFFNSEKNRIALYYEFRCDPDCGFGEILILQIHDGQWVIQERHLLWIS